MRVRRAAVVAFLVSAVGLASPPATAQGLTPAFTYQGQLQDGGLAASGLYDFEFALFGSVAGMDQVGPTLTVGDVNVNSGLFTVSLDFGPGIFDGTRRWLEVRVRPGASTGAYTTLSPRQELTATPNALFAAGVNWTGIAGKPAGFADNVDNDSGGDITGVTAGAGLTGGATSGDATLAVDTATIQSRVTDSCAAGSSIRVVNGDGTVACEPDDDTPGWGLLGNAGTDPATNFLGTSDNQTLVLRTNGAVAFRLVPGSVPNVLGGLSGNNLTAGVAGAVVAGGGQVGFLNRVTDNFGFVGGGQGNRAGDDAGTLFDGAWSTVGGGFNNTASGGTATVGGGAANTASGDDATVAGGDGNVASGAGSMVPGGFSNQAGGDGSFAGGFRAIVRDAAASGDADGDQGSFVWADTSPPFNAFTTTGPNQFLVRATGGVGINANDPGFPLDVNGIVRSRSGGFRFPDGTTQATAANAAADITAVNAGTGLTGGGTSGSVTLNVDLAGSGSANTVSRSDHNHFGQTWSGTGATGLRVNAVFSSGPALWGDNGDGGGAGVTGRNTSSTGNAVGVEGISFSSGGTAVRGTLNAPAGSGFAVAGSTNGSGGGGVFAHATSTTGLTKAVLAYNESTSGIGVEGSAFASTGSTIGVYGTVQSPNGTAVFGKATATGGSSVGVNGETNASGGTGVDGYAFSASGSATGVRGTSLSPAGFGGLFQNTAGGIAVALAGGGLRFADSTVQTTAATNPAADITAVNALTGLTGGGTSGDVSLAVDFGGSGAATTVSRSDHDHLGQSWSGVAPVALNVTNTGTGIDDGIYGTANGTGAWGVRGWATSSTGSSIGVLGVAGSTTGYGVYGQATAGTGVNYGVYGITSSGSGYAGYFVGNVQVTGTLAKGGGSFKIDHPLDPENKYLYHSFVESPDMKNIYDGVVTTGPDGFATVEMPKWFEALNRDFRYQLTVIGDGAWARARVFRKIADGRFVIQTDVPGTEVSWQVTGIRKDAFAEKHRIPVEQEKPEDERGTYLHPEAWDQPQEAGLDHKRSPMSGRDRPALRRPEGQ